MRINKSSMTGTIFIVVPEESGDKEKEREVNIPIRFEVCSCCQGKGTIVNPSVDPCGLGREDFDQDPDLEEDYYGGIFNVRCEACWGGGLEAHPDKGRMNAAHVEAWASYEENQFDRRMGRLESQQEGRWGA